jgi:hypothetical protein
VVAVNTAARYRPQSTPGVRVLCCKHLLYISSSAALSRGCASSAGPPAPATPEATPTTVETAICAPRMYRGRHPDRRKRLRRERRRGVGIAPSMPIGTGMTSYPPTVRMHPGASARYAGDGKGQGGMRCRRGAMPPPAPTTAGRTAAEGNGTGKPRAARSPGCFQNRS